MKNSNKLIAFAIAGVAILFANSVKAQTVPVNAFRLGFGVEGGVPTGNAHSISNIELGGTGRLQYGASSNLAITLTSGYYNFFGKSDPYAVNTKYASLGMVPVKAGIKAFVNSGFYFSAEAGAGFETRAFGVEHGVSTEGAEKDTKLILSPGLGYATKSIDVGVRYENYSGQSNNYGLVALRVAYGFGL